MQRTEHHNQTAVPANTPWRRARAALSSLVFGQASVYSTLLAIAGAVVFGLSSVLPDQGYQTVAFATPTLESHVAWDSEVDRFGIKVSRAFGVKEHVAVEFSDWILEAAERQELQPELLASLVLTESTFRKHVRSSVGAIGPAQVRPEYWSGFCGTSDLTDPEQNIYCGAQVLRYLKERCGGDYECALRAYNIGLYGSREQAGRRYVSRVGRYLDQLEAITL